MSRIRRMFVFGLVPVLFLSCLVFVYGWNSGVQIQLGGAEHLPIHPAFSSAAAGGAIVWVIYYIVGGGLPTFLVGAFVGLIMAGPKDTHQT